MGAVVLRSRGSPPPHQPRSHRQELVPSVERSFTALDPLNALLAPLAP